MSIPWQSGVPGGEWDRLEGVTYADEGEVEYRCESCGRTWFEDDCDDGRADECPDCGERGEEVWS